MSAKLFYNGGTCMSLGVLDDESQAGILAQEAISKRHCMRACSRSLLEAFGKSIHPNLEHTTILDTTQ
jgi:hypothetical protein